MGRCCRQWKCAIAFCNQQKKVKNFHFYYFFSCAHNREGKNSFPVLFTRSMKVTRFFLCSWSSTLFIVVQSIKQHVCQRLIWKCAIAHWRHVVLSIPIQAKHFGASLAWVPYAINLRSNYTALDDFSMKFPPFVIAKSSNFEFSLPPFHSIHHHFLFA